MPRPSSTGAPKPKREPAKPIASASLIVLCPLSRPAPDGYSYTVLMLRRTARDGSSFRDAHVFPGGALDAADAAFAKERLRDAPENGSPSAEGGGGMLDHVVCALRETFEETGLMLFPQEQRLGSAPPEVRAGMTRAVGCADVGETENGWKNLRERVHDDPTAFCPLLTNIFLRLSTSSSGAPEGLPLPTLLHHTNWITPRTVPGKRFNAQFFITAVQPDALGPAGLLRLASSGDAATPPSPSDPENGTTSRSEIVLAPDGTETTSLSFLTPLRAISLALHDKITLYPPQFYILADLLPFKTVEDVRFGLRFSPGEGGWTKPSTTEPEGVIQAAVPSKDEDGSPVFPLVLQGDHLHSSFAPASTEKKTTSPPLNRMLVTPRPRSLGGGLVVRGLDRRGLDSGASSVDGPAGTSFVLPDLKIRKVDEGTVDARVWIGEECRWEEKEEEEGRGEEDAKAKL